ncbi:DUF6597 domain-containing transcriptional factor [Pedobacter sp. L105]|uniref:DUF6597 domain-containing transcriptional factor n=1 Tax=Pedobacter sp. L105 TaxID=1641871 RepID=UPI00131D7543|nr:DUF6597 domain-containing transcriptional factor [Pedobacter sp. L105]
MQVLPSKPLSHLIKHYLFVESNTRNIKKFRLFPDGNTGIVFSFHNKLISGSSTFNQVDYLPDSLVYGQINSFKDIFCINETSLLIIVFHPHGLHQFLGIPANELIDKIIDLKTLFGSAGSEVTEQLQESQSLQQRIKIIESFLTQLLKGHTLKIQPIVIASVDFIVNHQGLASVNQLVSYTGYSGKSIERKFMETIGIFPKQFSKIVRLNMYLKDLRDNKNKKILDMAYANGYYDHSHAYKDFKKITGVTQRQYIGEFNALALNLLEFPQQ